MVNFCIIVFSFFILFQAESSLEVNVKGIAHGSGTLRVAIYQKQHKFLGEDGYFFSEITIRSIGPVTFNVPLSDGTYAISLFHDLNDDKELNTNLLGIPREPYGFSKSRGIFGPPSFDDASFAVPATKQITIDIK